MTTMVHGTSRRVAAISTGTLMLCLWGGGTAFAATSPVQDGSGDVIGSVTGTVTTTVSTLTNPTPTPTSSPLPLPVPTPSQLAPVSQTVDQVTSTVTGVLPTTAPTSAPTGGSTGGHIAKPGRETGGGTSAGTTKTDHVLGTHSSRRQPVSAPYVAMPSLNLGGLRANGAPLAAMTPTVAPEHSAVLAAGVSPALAPKPRALRPFGSGDERGPRGLFIALATMVIGGLAAGHVKIAQDRIATARS